MKFIIICLCFSVSAVAQDVPKGWGEPILLVETEHHQLYRTINDGWYNRVSTDKKESDELLIRGRHVTANNYLFQLVEKSKGDTIHSWSYRSTGSGDIPLWIFEDGTVCVSNYGRLGFRSLKNSDQYMPASAEAPKDLKVIEANALGAFFRNKNEPYEVYFIEWKPLKKSQWHSKKLVSSHKGMTNSYGGYLLREDVIFTEYRGNLTYYDLKTSQKKQYNLNDYFETPGFMTMDFLHFHEQELVFWYDNSKYAFDIKKQTIRGLNTLSPTKNNDRRPAHPRDYEQPDSLHVVIREDAGVLMQSKAGRLYVFPWLDDMDHALDFDKGRLVSDHDGISREEIGKILRNVSWQGRYICAAGTNKLTLFDLKTNQLKVYRIPEFNHSKSYTSTTKYKTWVHFNYYYPDDMSEVTEIIFIHKDQILLQTSDGLQVFDTESQVLYSPRVLK